MPTRTIHSARWAHAAAVVVAMLLLAGCGSLGAEATPLPTRTPLPTFTPTPQEAPPAADPNAAAQAPAAPVEGVQEQPPATVAAEQAQQPAAPPTEAPTPAPTATPVPVAAEVVTNDIINVRGGPGTNYNLVGSAQAGTKFKVTGKNQAGDWWQIDYNGQAGWVFGQLVTATGAEAVAIAQNIPVPPTAAPAPPPTNTPVPQPPAEAQPQPTAAPSKKYFFNIQVVSKCERQPAGNWFEGKTYVGGQPQSGYKVVFSAAPDGGWITEPMTTGPHPGYPGWDQGYYSHIIRPTGPIAGTWYVWVVDDGGQRISEIASFTTTGEGEGCNQAVVDFDSR